MRSGVILSPPGIYTVIPLTGYTTDHIQTTADFVSGTEIKAPPRAVLAFAGSP